jgi:hypothetical protein|tara:strand:- start:246 stop:458 length:213 start_codon:yes stop_codon:yes gene_type:complete
MKIKDIDESFSGAIAGVAMPLGGKKKKKPKSEDAQIGGYISNTKKRYGPAKGPKFTAGAGMKNATYPGKQ